ncbi:FkbM family methyltransferase [Primorskyibacter sp. S187A]|uniref:FkbM family methyltransferase n=1 Tax=Primorskyibacter sp. S187A TaxID=3415130 RepID=UPI003C7C32CE
MSADVSDDLEERGFLKSAELKIPKHPMITTGRRRLDLRDGTYELKETRAVKRIVEAEDIVLELGGGIGYMSTVLAALCGAREVHTFEANPGLLPYMHDMHRANGVSDRVQVHHALLAAQAGPPQNFYVRNNFLASSMDPDVAAYDEVVPVEVRDLNATLQTLQPSVLVCDIEGAEAHLLPAGDFSMLRAAIVELHPQWIGQAGVQAVFDTMHRAGLTYYHRGSEGKVVVFLKGF